jgi:hypothetical protein
VKNILESGAVQRLSPLFAAAACFYLNDALGRMAAMIKKSESKEQIFAMNSRRSPSNIKYLDI